MKRCISLVSACLALTAIKADPTLKEYKETQADAADAEAAAAAKQSRMAAVDKVITMLENLRSRVLDEGEKEAKTYNKFACFCKDVGDDKNQAVSSGTDEKSRLSADITQFESERAGFDRIIEDSLRDISETENAMKTETQKRSADKTVYETNTADLTAALDALKSAIESLKASKSVSLVQDSAVADKVRKAVLIADALGLGNAMLQKQASVFLQQGSRSADVPMEDYSFHSESIITTLEKLVTDFRSQKNTVDETEVSAAAAHTSLMQSMTHDVNMLQKEMDDAKKSKDEKQTAIASTSEQMSIVAATLMDDKEYLRDLRDMCNKKALTWDQRSRVRLDELSALAAAAEIIRSAVAEKTTAATIRFAQQGVSVRLAQALAKNSEAMEALEADAEESDDTTASFLQQSSSRVRTRTDGAFLAPVQTSDERSVVATLFRNKGQELRSTLLSSLAVQVSEDKFAKIKTLIEQLIERLLKEAGEEANKKGWCDKSISAAEQTRSYASQAVSEINGKMATLEALRNKLTEEIGILGDDISALGTAKDEAIDMRSAEKGENEETILEATAGMDAVTQAMDLLSKFYKTAAKESVQTNFAQRGPAEDAPDAGFDSKEAYTGSQGAAGGVLGMLEVIKSDFARTVSETTKAEAQAQEDHLSFLTETGKSIAEKDVAHKQKSAELSTTESTLEDAGASLTSKTTIIADSVKELINLKSTCNTGMTYEERVGRREDEIEALKKGLCILENHHKYGPAGSGGDC